MSRNNTAERRQAAANPFDILDEAKDRLRELAREGAPLRNAFGFRDAFHDLIQQTDFIPKVLFEARPPFVQRSAADFGEGDRGPRREIQERIRISAGREAWSKLRQPYRHQVEAFRAYRERGQSLVIATGTASGKTEAMALPILDAVLRRKDARPAAGGVLACFVFPLNALAVDQSERLRSLAAPLGIRVGTMTGLTPTPEKEKLRANPPEVLITNFTMLEYMLLRPADRKLLGPALAFLALDEAHLYRGALGKDMGLLFRRLRLHLEERGGDPRGLTVYLASATFGGSDREAREFAGDLTGVEPGKVDVILPTYDLEGMDLLPPEVRTVVAPRVSGLDLLPGPGRWCQRAPAFVELKKDASALPAESIVGARRAIERWLSATEDEEAYRWQLKVHGLAHGLGGLLIDLPPGGDGDRAFGRMREEEHIGTGHRARSELEPVDESGRPLFRLVACDRCGMPYLFGFVHSAEDGKDRLFTQPPPRGEDSRVRGLFLAWPEFEDAFPPDDQKELEWIGLHSATREIEDLFLGKEGCRRFLRIQDKQGTSLEAAQLKQCRACGARSARSSVATDFVTDTEEATAVLAKCLLDSQCEGGSPSPTRQGSAEALRRLFDASPAPKLLTFSDTRRQAARFAPICTSRQLRRWILQRMRMALLERMDLARKEQVPEGLILEKLVDKIVAGCDEHLRRFLEAVQFEKRAPRPDIEKEVEFEVLRLFAKRGRRSERGETHCLATVNPDLAVLAAWLDGSGLPDRDAARSLYLRLLDEARYDMFWEKGHRVEGDEGFPVGQNQKRRFHGLEASRDSGESRQTWFSWILGEEKEEQETSLSRLVVSAMGGSRDKAARDRLLAELWKHWIGHGVLAPSTEPASDHVLDWEKLRFEMPSAFRRCSGCGYVGPEDRWMGAVCGACGSPASELCKTFCPAPEDFLLYSGMEHTAQWGQRASKLVMQAFKDWTECEGSARGPLHLLSSSTTYEVGVDLGDLSQVLLRNLPASGASLVQRIGRAGRRPGQAALTLTYLRPYATDRVILLGPVERLRVVPPRVKRDVVPLPMVRRHVRAALLSWVLPRCTGLVSLGDDEDLGEEEPPENRPPSNVSVAQFYIDGAHLERAGASDGARKHLEEILARYPLRLPRDAFSMVLEGLRTVPEAYHRRILEYLGDGIPEKERSLDAMREDLVLSLTEHRAAFENECRVQYALVEDVLRKLTGDSQQRALDVLREQLVAKYAPSRSAGLWQRKVIPEWATSGVIPAYAFPIHPVELDVRSYRGRLLELERDATLGVGEYVPGAEVTAGGKVYKSEGIRLAVSPQPSADGLEAEWQFRLAVEWCIYCATCGHLKISKTREELAQDLAYGDSSCPGCGEHLFLPTEYEPPVTPKKKGKRKTGVDGALGLDLHLFPVVRPKGFITFDKGAKVFAKERAVYPQPPQWLPEHAPAAEEGPLRDWKMAHRLLEKQKIAVLNLGPFGHRGFRLCPNTGLDLDIQLGKDRLGPGKTIRWFQGARYEVPLAPIPHRVGIFTDFETEVLVLEPEGGSSWDEVIAWSLMTAFLVMATEVLQAERREVGGLVYSGRRGRKSSCVEVVLYDNVHGGAGLMQELSRSLDGKDGLIAKALELLDRCECRLACPDCLKLPWNQRDHGKLDRLAAREWLQRVRR